MASNTYSPGTGQFGPLATNPNANYISGAQALPTNYNTAGRGPVSANGLTGGYNPNAGGGGGQSTLLTEFQNSLGGGSLSDLLKALINNPAAAKAAAGSGAVNYTPNSPANAWRANFQAPANTNGTTGWGNGMIGNNIALNPGGTPNSPTPPATPAPANPMGLGAVPQVIDPNNAYQQWIQQQQQLALQSPQYIPPGQSADGASGGAGGSAAG